MTQRTIVVGGGIIGMLTARELNAAGQQVLLLERQQTGRESSWAGGGIVSPLFPWRYLDSVTALASWSQVYYPQICEELHKDTGLDPQYTETGMLMAASDEIDMATDWAKQHHRNLELIDAEKFRQLEPQAANPPQTGIWMPQVGQVRNPRLTQAILADLQRRGVKIITDSPVTEVNCTSTECHGVSTATEHHPADNVIVCAGSWSQQVLSTLSTPPDIRPVRGQMLLFKTPPGTISRIVLEKNRYIIPRRDGHVLFGSTMEEVGFDQSTTQETFEELHSIVIERFPVLKNYPVIKHWAGLRPGSPAGVPYIAAHPNIANLFINAGQFRNGIVLGAASARLACDLMLGRTPILDPKPYSWTAARG